MKIALRKLFYISFLFIPCLFFSSCKEKGCTDPNALNYNSVAEEDDGTCILCNGVTDTIAIDSCYTRDNSFGSIHYQDTVGIFDFFQIHTQYQHIECGVNKCIILLRYRSFVPERMSFNFNVQSMTGGSTIFNYNDNLIVLGLETLNFGSIPEQNIFEPCMPISDGTVTCYVQNIFYN